MTQENKPDQAGAAKEPVKQEEASNDRKPGELSIEDLAKVSGGLLARSASTIGTTNLSDWALPKPTIFGRK